MHPDELLMARITLPEEIVVQIVNEACRAAEDGASAEEHGQKSTGAVIPPTHGGLALHQVDRNTARNVMLVCRTWYRLGVPWLYGFPKLASPSQIPQFMHALTQRPCLGAFVRGLVLGPPEPPAPIHPAVFHSYEHAFALTPEVKTKGGAYPCDPHGSLLPHTVELDIAENAALHIGGVGEHGIDLFTPGFDREGEWIGLDLWYVRLHEVKALLRWVRALAYQARSTWASEYAAGWDASKAWALMRDEVEEAGACWHAFLFESSDQVHPLLRQRTGTRHDPSDWGGHAHTPLPLPDALPVEQYEVLHVLQWRTVQAWPARLRSRLPRWLCAILAQAQAYGQWLAQAATAKERAAISTDPYCDDPCLRYAHASLRAFFRMPEHWNDPAWYAYSGAMHMIWDSTPPEPAAGQTSSTSPAERLLTGQTDPTTTPPITLGMDPTRLLLPGIEAPHVSALQAPRSWSEARTLVRCILSLVPHLSTLHVFRMLAPALADDQGGIYLPGLERLAISPSPPYGADPLAWAQVGTLCPGLAHVAITGCVLRQCDARSLAGTDGRFLELGTIHWVVHEDEALEDTLESMDTLLQHNDTRQRIRKLHMVVPTWMHDTLVENVPAALVQDDRLALESEAAFPVGSS